MVNAASHVPLMFNMPGPDLIIPEGMTNPAFVHEGLAEALTELEIGAGDHPRNWHMGHILKKIVSKVRYTTDP